MTMDGSLTELPYIYIEGNEPKFHDRALLPLTKHHSTEAHSD